MVSWAAVLALATVGQDGRKESQTGDIRVHEGFESKVLENQRRIWVYLPPGYDRANDTSYKVLYLHDGQNVFDGMTSFIPNQEWRADEAAEGLIGAGLIEPVIIVGIDNAGAKRAYEYLPTKGRVGNGEDGGGADLYLRFVTEEVMPFMSKTYRVMPGAENTAVAGSSLGGVVSMHMAFSRPDVFGAAGVFSPSLWWDDKLMIRRVREMTGRPAVRVWMDMGDGEGASGVSNAREAAAVFREKGWGPGDFVYFEEAGVGHNERAWAGRFDLFLMWLYGRR